MSKTRRFKSDASPISIALCKLRILHNKQQLYKGSFEFPHFSISSSTSSVSGFHFPALNTVGMGTTFFALVFVGAGFSVIVSVPSALRFIFLDPVSSVSMGPEAGCLRF